ncbi:hypothetical protein BVC80_8957g15 [Macleaya cordata]|uniref:Uncharacterized protein n=1 Tax=Macleaya cordata TaxID=56857 RepID=A0A200QWK7_MACCD|nr:hypothetical protein BVC80_8957g15 [Macleaya cordata]
MSLSLHQLNKSMRIQKNIVKFPGKHTTIDICDDPVSPVAIQQWKAPQGIDTGISLVGPSHFLVVESNENAAVRDQSNGNASLLQQPLIGGQETSSFHIEHLDISLFPEAQQTNDGIENNNSAATTPTRQPTTTAAVTESENEAQVPNLENAMKVALLVIPISAGSIVSVTSGLFANQKTDLTHEVLFMAYTLLNYIALMAALLLLLLITLKRPRIPGLAKIVQLTMWFTLGAITYALSCAISIILAKGLVEVIFILVIPFLMGLFVIVLNSHSHTN